MYDLRVVIADSSPADAEVVLDELRRWMGKVDASVVATQSELDQALAEGPFDLVLSEYALPQLTAFDALQTIQDRGLDIPLIVVAGTGTAEEAAEALSRGVSGYVLKRRLGHLLPAAERALAGRSLRQERYTLAEMSKRLSASVQAERDKVETILSSIAEGVFIVDDRQSIVMWSRSAERILGIVADDAVGRHCYDVLGGSDAGGHPSCMSGCQTLTALSGDAVSFSDEVWVRRPAGKPLCLEVSMARMEVEGAERPGVVHVFRDVSARKEAEQLKSLILAMVSHELRTPLALIGGFARTMLMDAAFSPEAYRAMLEALERNASQLSRLVESLLAASRLEKGKLPVRPVPVAIPTLAESVVGQLQRTTSAHQISLCTPADLPLVKADGERIKEVLANLLDNAIKYSPRGGTIEVTGRVVGGAGEQRMVQVSVRDQGEGIPPAVIERIFEPFYQVDRSATRRTRGVGLGLYLCRWLIEAHGGRIWTDSVPGEGSTFHFTLPVA